MARLSAKKIVQKTVGMSVLHGMSKALGFLRELALARFLGVGAVADAFFAAWRFPSLIRRFLAEGALNAAAVPYIHNVYQKEGDQAVYRVTTALVIATQVILLLCIVGVWLYPGALLAVFVPGWDPTQERYRYAAYALAWSVGVIVPFSASALLASALQTVHHFFVPAISQSVFNACLALHICIGILYGYQLTWLLAGILCYSFIVLAIHYGVYRWYNLKVLMPDRKAWSHVRHVLWILLSCLGVYAAFEINMLVDHALVSFLYVGSQSLLYYTSAFVQMPLSIYIAAFTTIMLPQFTAVRNRRGRQQLYLIETIKTALALLLPTSIVMIVFARTIFTTTILPHGADAAFVTQAAYLLMIATLGLIPFAINRICMNVLYSISRPREAGWITAIGTGINVLLSSMSMPWCGLYGIVAATVFAACCKTYLYIYMLAERVGIALSLTRLRSYLWRYIMQLAVTGWGFYLLYHAIVWFLALFSGSIAWFFRFGFGIWLWLGPLIALWLYILYVTRHLFGARLHFLRDLPVINDQT